MHRGSGGQATLALFKLLGALPVSSLLPTQRGPLQTSQAMLGCTLQRSIAQARILRPATDPPTRLPALLEVSDRRAAVFALPAVDIVLLAVVLALPAPAFALSGISLDLLIARSEMVTCLVQRKLK